MEKTYTRINWENEPSVQTPLNAMNLNKIDYAVDEMDNRIIDLDNRITDDTEKIRIDYNGTDFRHNGVVLDFKDIYDYLTDAPNFVYVVYGSRAYLCSFMNENDGSVDELRFESVINNDSMTKASSIYITSADGVAITNVSVTNINSENVSNKVATIGNVTSNTTYPSTAAVKDYVDNNIAKIKDELARNKEVDDARWKMSEGIFWDAVTQKETGITLPPSGAKYMALDEVHGKTEQAATNGYNLSPITHNKAWNQTADGEISGRRVRFDNPVDTSVNKTLTCSFKNNSNTNVMIYYRVKTADGQVITKQVVDSTSKDAEVVKTFTVVSDAVMCYFFLTCDGVADTSTAITNAMLEYGSVAHDFEVYTGGIPSPNPQYPQEIEPVDDFSVYVSNNYFNPKQAYNSERFRSNDDSVVQWSTHHLPNGKYIVTANKLRDTYLACVFASTTYKASPSSSTNGVVGSREITVTDGVLYIGLYGYSRTGAPSPDAKYTLDYDTYMAQGTEVKIIPAGSDIENAEYQQRTITPPRPLNKLDNNADKCNVVSGKWEYLTKTVGADALYYQYDGNMFYSNVAGIAEYLKDGIKSTHYSVTNDTSAVTMPNNTIIKHSGKQIRIKDERFTATSDFVNWLKSNDVKIMYHLAEAETEAINEEELRFLRNLSNLPHTYTVYITDNHGRDASYIVEYIRKLSEVVG